MANIGVAGSGSWGCAIARLLANNGHEVTLWAHREETCRELAQKHENEKRLPGVKLPESIVYTSDVHEAARGKDILVFAVPSAAVRSTAAKFSEHVADGTVIVSLTKGIERSTGFLMTEVIKDEIPQCAVVALSGPSHAEEVGADLPTAIVAGSENEETAKYVQTAFASPVFRVYTSTDIKGIEIGGALKNVIALAAGMADGLGYGDNTKAALITRGIAEISRLGRAMGAKPETFAGLTGIGDLIVTCASRHSRNRKAGFLIGRGYTADEAMKEVNMVVEGVHSAQAALELAGKYSIEMPIVTEVNRILFEGRSAGDAVAKLMGRDSKPEAL